MIFRAIAPLRVSFCGGGTEVSPYLEEFGGLVLSCTINKYAYASLRQNNDREVRIQSLDYDTIVRYRVSGKVRYDGNLDLAKAVVKSMNCRHGVDLFVHTDAPPGSGLGASSAVVVAVIGSLKEYLQRPLTSYEIAEMAFEIERKELGIKGGKQDQYASAFGGFNLIEFHPDATIVNPLRVSRNTLNELHYHLMLCYTGATRVSAGIIDAQVKRYAAKNPECMSAMREIKDITRRMKDALLRDELYSFGELLHVSGQLKKKMNPLVTTPQIDEMYAEGCKHGAIGGKLLGAGGGGYLLFFVEFHRKHKVAEVLRKMGGQIVDFTFEHEGLQTWRADNREYEKFVCTA